MTIVLLALLSQLGATPASAQPPVVQADSVAGRGVSSAPSDSSGSGRETGPIDLRTLAREAAGRDTTASRWVVVPTPADSTSMEVERVLGEAAARRERRHRMPTPPKRFDAPRWVMLRSLVVPGWGQLHNGSWVKALGVAAAEGAFLVRIVNDERDLDRLSRQADEAQAANDEIAFNQAVDAYNARLSETTARRWLLGGLLAYALMDAYVDAHFAHFNVDFDAALLPGGHAGPSALFRMGVSF